MRAELIGASVLGLPSELPCFLAAGIGKPLPLPESAFPCSQGPGLSDGMSETWKKQARHA